MNPFLEVGRGLVSAVVALFLAVAVSACVSTGLKPPTVDTMAAIVRPVAKNVVNRVLQKNPGYDTALLALAEGAGEAVNGGGALTPESIRAFVDTLATRFAMDAQSKLEIASALDDVVQIYRETYGGAVARATDPNVRRILTAFAAGVRDGVALHRAMSAAPPVSGVERPRPAFGALGVPAMGRA